MSIWSKKSGEIAVIGVGLDEKRGQVEGVDAGCLELEDPIIINGRITPAEGFDGAPAAEIERCRMQPDRDGLEEKILSAIGVRAGEE